MNPSSIKDIVRLALWEDVGPGDLTTRLTVDPDQPAKARVVSRGSMILSGLEVAHEVMAQVDETIKFIPAARNGDHLKAGDVACYLEGPAASILTAERVALNFLMRLSGVATTTNLYAAEVVGYNVKVVDTRKTTPGLRFLEKQAVRHGGGHNHRFALYDGILIKDNHIAASGSITEAIAKAKDGAPHGLKIEVEVDTLDQLKEALEAGADLVLLDNMTPGQLRDAVKIRDDFFAPAKKQVLLEASGGINLATIKSVAASGVDYISVGALTHSAKAVDLGLDWN